MCIRDSIKGGDEGSQLHLCLLQPGQEPFPLHLFHVLFGIINPGGEMGGVFHQVPGDLLNLSEEGLSLIHISPDGKAAWGNL